MIQVVQKVTIDASPDEVFALVADVHQCGKLNPWINVININAEPAGPMRKGTKYHYRVVVKGKMTEYTSEVLALEPGHAIVIQTQTEPPLNVKYRIEAAQEGSILRQEVTTELPQQELQAIEIPGWFSKLMGKLTKNTQPTSQDAELHRQEEQQIQQELQLQLDEWLGIVKKYLETQRGTFRA